MLRQEILPDSDILAVDEDTTINVGQNDAQSLLAREKAAQDHQAKINNQATTIAMGTNHSLPETLGAANEYANTGFNAGLFTLLSNIKNIGSLITSTAKYLFPIAFGLKAADWFLYAWKYMRSSNKNAGKTNNLIVRTITTAMLGLIVFGGAFIATGLSHLLFAGIMAIDVAINLGKSIYFGVSAIKKPAHEKSFYLGKLKESAIKTVVGGILLAALTVTLVYGSPAIAAGVVAGFGIAAAATLAFVVGMGIYHYFRNRNAAKTLRKEITVEEAPSQVIANKPRHRLSTTMQRVNNQVEYNAPFMLAQNGFFSNRVQLLKPLSNNIAKEIADLKRAIEQHLNQLVGQINTAKNSFIENNIWSQGSKRNNKHHALQFLSGLVNQFTSIAASVNTKQAVTVNGIVFNDYQNIQDLTNQIDNYVKSHFDSSYQAFFQDLGGVETLFKQAYKLLATVTLNNLQEQPVLQPTIQKRSRMNASF